MSEKQTTNNTTAQIQKMQMQYRAGKFLELSKRVKNMRADLERVIESLNQKAKQTQQPPVAVAAAKPAPTAEKPVQTARPQQTAAAPKGPTQQQVRTRQFDQNDRRQFGPRGERMQGNSGNFAPRGPRPNGPQGQNGQRPAWNKTPSSRPAFGGPRPQPQVELTAPKKSTARKKDNARVYDDKKSLNKKAQVMRGYVSENYDEDRNVTVRRNKSHKEVETHVAPAIDHAIITKENITVKELAEKIGKPVVEIMSKFMLLGMMVNINSNIDFASAELIANELGVTLEQKLDKSFEEKMVDMFDEQDDEKDLVTRPPVVTVMGHVDHGKTSLLDKIRQTDVTLGEAGGITQHIGAYTISVNDKKITFIDTPGHAAFSAMRARGAQVTDIAILVVAADDGIMPQTIEAIKHIKDAKVPMIVAINKIDKPEANIEKVKSALLEYDVVSSEWGGDAIMVPISAKTGQGIDELLEMILFVAEYQNLRANPNRTAKGTVIEAMVDKGKGPVTTVLVQNGTLKRGDNIVAGTAVGKIRAMLGDNGKQVKSAGPSYAVEILGLSSVPNAGDAFYVVDEKMSKKVAAERKNIEKLSKIKAADLSVEALMDRMHETEFKHYNVIVKGDVQGSVEALQASLAEISNEEVKVKCIHGGVGAVNENDVSLAQASNALIIAFNVKTDFKAKVIAEKYKVEIKNSKIIYDVLEYVTKKINAMLTPKYKEVVIGHAEIRMVFKASKIGSIAGSYVLDGKVSRNAKARLMRDGKQIYDGSIGSLQREKNDAKDVAAGYECGIVLSGYNDIKEGDIIEAYILERIN